MRRLIILLALVSLALATSYASAYEKKMYECTNPNVKNCTNEFFFVHALREPVWRCPDRDRRCQLHWRTVCTSIEGKCFCKKSQRQKYFECPDGCRLTEFSFPYCHCPKLPDCYDGGFLNLGIFANKCGYKSNGECYCEGLCIQHYSFNNGIEDRFN